MNFLKTIIFIFILLFCFDSSAQRKKTTINFEDQLVEGSATSPDLFFLMQKGDFDFSKLIKLRENFLPEMRRSKEEIVIKRGSEQ